MVEKQNYWIDRRRFNFPGPDLSSWERPGERATRSLIFKEVLEAAMPEKAPMFTVTDRRKFTNDGELRPGVVASEPPAESTPSSAAPVAAPAAGIEKAAHEAAHPQVAAATPDAPPETVEQTPDESLADDEALLPEPTAAESAEQHAAYKESSRSLDELIAAQNPKARAAGPMTFDRLVQSIYMTAAIQLGAGVQPGEQPRVDILGARQSIDMLAVLAEKTKGNLSDTEQRLLQNALFELRMSFLEITNAIATSAQSAGAAGQGGPQPVGAKPGFRPGTR